MKILFIGDIVGKSGRKAVAKLIPEIKKKHQLELVIANAENAAGGFGLTPNICDELLDCDVDILTSGNHIWKHKEIIDYIENEKYLLRPANYPEGTPGHGSSVIRTGNGYKIGIINLLGRIFMDNLDCPFRTAEAEINKLDKEVKIIIVDFHAEATSEKAALGWFLDGKVSAVIGTHTHVQTSDEKILPKKTAFITDAGMTGSTHSVIGIKKEIAIQKFLTLMPQKFEMAKKGTQLQGVIVHIDEIDGKGNKIERVRMDLVD